MTTEQIEKHEVDVSESRTRVKIDGVEILRRWGIWIAALILFVTLSLISDVFLTTLNLTNVLDQWSPTGLIAIALTVVIISGELDLSAASIYGVAGIVAALTADDLGSWPAIALGVGTGIGLGMVNGVLVLAGINSFMGTLATSIIFAGLALALTQGTAPSVIDPAFGHLGNDKLFGVTYTIYIFAAGVVLLAAVMGRTRFGRRVFAVGGNPVASRLSGVSVRGIKARAMVISGAAAGLAGVIVVSRSGQGQVESGLTLEITALAAVLLGGTSVAGGEGSVLKTVGGLLVLAMIGNGYNLLSFDPIYYQLVQGGILLGAIVLVTKGSGVRFTGR